MVCGKLPSPPKRVQPDFAKGGSKAHWFRRFRSLHRRRAPLARPVFVVCGASRSRLASPQ